MGVMAAHLPMQSLADGPPADSGIFPKPPQIANKLPACVPPYYKVYFSAFCRKVTGWPSDGGTDIVRELIGSVKLDVHVRPDSREAG